MRQRRMINITKNLAFSLFLMVSTLVSAQKKPTLDDFKPVFTVLYTEKDPNLAMRSAGIPGVKYNVVSWKSYPGKTADLPETEKDEATAGDGFDDRILKGNSNQRTVNPMNAGFSVQLVGKPLKVKGDTIFYSFPTHELLELKAYIIKKHEPYPLLHFDFKTKKNGWYSVGYTGAPTYPITEVEEIWQPLVWQEKRFPDKPYLTLAFRSPIPSTLVQVQGTSIGVLANSSEFPFDPLPNHQNSRFGISVRNNNGEAQPQLWAPVIGGINSNMKTGQYFSFNCLLPIISKPLTASYEEIARTAFAFKSYRHNDISNLNDVIENMTDYALSDFAWFIDSLKGCAYSTDVPGAVKNVSSLNPINMAMLMDNPEIFETRGYPIMEYMLSRDKFLFALDRKQKIQNPSRKMTGPVAPISELTALYEVLGKENDFLLNMAKDEFNSQRTRNLDVPERGDSWMNAMYLYRATNDKQFLALAKNGADQYLKNRVNRKQVDFSDPYAGGSFFWPSYTNKWIELLELYELTADKKYLDAAQDGARHYAQFTWMAPQIPDSSLLVNKGGKAPIYWYLKSKGHKQMYFPEEEVPAWRLSEIGLTAESSGTSTGHRAIFMANYAPWMLRLGYYAKDSFLQEIAKNTIVGRYRNFPGYHINTERTTAYEKLDFPLHEHSEQSVNSFHYNHIMPMVSLLLDYLVTDVFVKSKGEISFPSQFIEGYAYLQSKMYGHNKGTFYGAKDVQLWLPKNLLTIENVELNYIAARKDNKLYLAFTNQSGQAVTSNFIINQQLITLRDNAYQQQISVPANGIKTLILDVNKVQINFQNIFEGSQNSHTENFIQIPTGNTKAMLFSLGKYEKRAYIFLEDDDDKLKSVKLSYKDNQGEKIELTDSDYPFEFTIPLPKGMEQFQFQISVTQLTGKEETSNVYILGGDPKHQDKKENIISEFHQRRGIPNVLSKANSKQPLTVAYIGGSITRSENMYRNQTTKHLQALFPKSKIKEINAGISGTDADLGACRIEQQVIKFNPDLIFIEFAVNGGFALGIEGMIRKIKTANSKTDICLIYTVRDTELNNYLQGNIPPVIARLEELAAYYQLPSIHLGLEPAKLLKQGKIIAKGNVKSTKKEPIFSYDGTHPTPYGGDLYAAAIDRAFQNFITTPAINPIVDLPVAYLPDNWEDAQMLEPNNIQSIKGSWKKINPINISNLKPYKEWFPELLVGHKPKDSFSVKFRGNMIGLFDIGGPEAGFLTIKVDGKKQKVKLKEKTRWQLSQDTDAEKGINRFNAFCNNRHRGQFFILELPYGDHLVEFTIAHDFPDKKKVLGKHQLEDIQSNPEKYNKSVIYVGKILLRGTLI